jgi:hypothetical protein
MFYHITQFQYDIFVHHNRIVPSIFIFTFAYIKFHNKMCKSISQAPDHPHELLGPELLLNGITDSATDENEYL